ncbi:hypothetical protein OAE46_00985 [bacterium]|nr:hypothetical protein [bacterium]
MKNRADSDSKIEKKIVVRPREKQEKTRSPLLTKTKDVPIELCHLVAELESQGIDKFTKVPSSDRFEFKRRRYPLEATVTLPEGWYWSLCYYEPEASDWFIKANGDYPCLLDGDVILEHRPQRFTSIGTSEVSSFEDWYSGLIEAIGAAERGQNPTRQRQAAYIKRVIEGAERASKSGKYGVAVGLLAAISDTIHKFLRDRPVSQKGIWNLCVQDAVESYRSVQGSEPSRDDLCSYLIWNLEEAENLVNDTTGLKLWGKRVTKKMIQNVIDRGRSDLS